MLTSNFKFTKRFAIKVLSVKQVRKSKEVPLSRESTSPFIISFKESFFQDELNYCIVFEYCEVGFKINSKILTKHV